MVRAKVTVNKTRAMKKLQKLQKDVMEAGYATVSEMGQLGKTYAKSIVYYDTGYIYSRISKKTLRRKQPEALIYIKGNGKHKNDFDLVRWSHTSQKANDHFKSGNPKFMYATKDYLNRVKKGVATGRYKNIKIR